VSLPSLRFPPNGLPLFPCCFLLPPHNSSFAFFCPYSRLISFFLFFSLFYYYFSLKNRIKRSLRRRRRGWRSAVPCSSRNFSARSRTSRPTEICGASASGLDRDFALPTCPRQQSERKKKYIKKGGGGGGGGGGGEGAKPQCNSDALRRRGASVRLTNVPWWPGMRCNVSLVTGRPCRASVGTTGLNMRDRSSSAYTITACLQFDCSSNLERRRRRRKKKKTKKKRQPKDEGYSSLFPFPLCWHLRV
jgi:hypothetical protein